MSALATKPLPPGARPFDVVGFGVNAMDITAAVDGFPEPDTKAPMQAFTIEGGGITATAMVACARLGLKTRYIGKFGSDFWSRLGMRSLTREGIDTSAVLRTPGEGHVSIVIADRRTHQRTLFRRRPAAYDIAPDEMSRAAIVAGRLLHVDGVDAAAAAQAMRWAREAGMIVTMDGDRIVPGVEAACREADLLVCGPRFLAGVTGKSDLREGLAAFAGLGVARVAVTLGEKGSLGFAQGRFCEAPAFLVESVDTNGAGDVFHGACAVGELREWPLLDTLTFASAVAAMKCRKPGGRAGAPTLAQTQDFLRERGFARLAAATT
ncbi:MAG: hypothetical protein JNK46_06130 [Methylobacteriaceae bacterium]|nr:hypothetical protein [Methylobacteriaceae bacterium]